MVINIMAELVGVYGFYLAAGVGLKERVAEINIFEGPEAGEKSVGMI